MAKTRILGIDLGTSNAVMAAFIDGKPQVIPNAEGQMLTPCVIAYVGKGRRLLVGGPARSQAETNPGATVFSFKRLLGQRFDTGEIKSDMRLAPFPVQQDQSAIAIVLGGRRYTPVELSALILRKLKRDAEAYLGGEISEVIITVPAYFNDLQRQATKAAGSQAGLKVIRIVSEPTAACLAYGLHQTEGRRVAVFHFGGGSTDVSILEIGDGVFEVKSTTGNTHLGGDDIDQTIVDWVSEDFLEKHRIDLRKNRQALQRLKWAAEKVKCDLSSLESATLELPFVCEDGQGGFYNLSMELTRRQFGEMVAPFMTACTTCCKAALRDAGLETVDAVILTGQQTRMPVVRDAMREVFGQHTRVLHGIDPISSVAMGAAILGGVMRGEIEDVLLLDVTPLSLGIETLGGVFTRLIERNTTIPTRKSEIFSIAEDNRTVVDIPVFQGDRERVSDNIRIGKLRLEGIVAMTGEKPQIEVTFDIEANGVLNVSARDLGSGREQRVTLVTDTGIDAKQKLPVIVVDEAWDAIIDAETECGKLARQEVRALTASIFARIEELKTNIDGRLDIGKAMESLRREVRFCRSVSHALDRAERRLATPSEIMNATILHLLLELASNLCRGFPGNPWSRQRSVIALYRWTVACRHSTMPKTHSF